MYFSFECVINNVSFYVECGIRRGTYGKAAKLINAYLGFSRAYAQIRSVYNCVICAHVHKHQQAVDDRFFVYATTCCRTPSSFSPIHHVRFAPSSMYTPVILWYTLLFHCRSHCVYTRNTRTRSHMIILRHCCCSTHMYTPHTLVSRHFASQPHGPKTTCRESPRIPPEFDFARPCSVVRVVTVLFVIPYVAASDLVDCLSIHCECARCV